MRVIVWGLGHVGSVCAASFAAWGHDVVGVDSDPAVVEAIRAGQCLIGEPGLDALVRDVLAAGRLVVGSGSESGVVSGADVSVVAVGTPGTDGPLALDATRAVIARLGRELRASTLPHVVIVVSTTGPGTIRQRLAPLLEQESGRPLGAGLGLVANPVFLREGTALADFGEPEQIVFGASDDHAASAVGALYASREAPLLRMSIEETELLKLANNAFHALKIGFANEIGRLGEALRIDGRAVMRALASDRKLNASAAYLQPGPAFGGPCLGKDLRALAHAASDAGVELPIVNAILPSNRITIESVVARVKLEGVQRVAILGLAFKSGTRDLRDSPALALAGLLARQGIDLALFDPELDLGSLARPMRQVAERELPDLEDRLVASAHEAVARSELVVVTQDRPAFRAAIAGCEPDRIVELQVGSSETGRLQRLA